MKKYILVLVAFSLFITLLGFHNSASAQVATTLPVGCTSTAGYSPTTGVKCDTVVDPSLPVGCTSTEGYSPTTGTKCDSSVSTNFPPGCTSTSGFSPTTGQRCGDSSNFPLGCSSNQGFSSTTGASCVGSTNPTPVITSISPSSGPVGTIVTLNGSGFGSASMLDITSVDPNTSENKGGPNPISVSSSAITFVMPSDLNVGVYNIRVVGSQYQTHGTLPTSNTVLFTVTNSTYPPGCTSNTGFSSTTGESCSGVTSTPVQIYPVGCTSTSGFSLTTGASCGNPTPAPTPTHIPTSADQQVTFTKNFITNQSSAPTILSIEADNEYSVSVNGSVVGSSNLEANFFSPTTYNITPYLRIGSNNVLSITVTNQISNEQGFTWSSNPAGLAYTITNGGTMIASSDGSEQASYAGANDSAVVIPYNLINGMWNSMPSVSWVWDSKLLSQYGGLTTNQQPTITSITPSSAPAGSPVSINGSGFNSAYTYKVDFYSPTTGADTYVNVNAISGNALTFAVPNLASGNYQVMVTTNASASKNLTNSIMVFTITITNSSTQQPTVTVLSPNAQDVWKIGETRQISWQTNNVPSGDQITVYIVPAGNTSANYNLAQSIPNTGSYNYVVDDPSKFSSRSPLYVAGGQFKIFICATQAFSGNPFSGNLCTDGSGYSSSFTITSATTPVTPIATLTADGQHSKTYNVGDTVHYSWTSSNADTFSSTYTSSNPICGPGGAWVANTVNGTLNVPLPSTFATCVWNVTYSAKNSKTGQLTSDSITLSVNPIPSTAPSTILNLQSVSWMTSISSGDTYYNPRVNFGGVDQVPFNDTATATKWCQVVPGKTYTSGVSVVAGANPTTGDHYRFDGSLWANVGSGFDYPRYYTCSPDTVSASSNLGASVISGLYSFPVGCTSTQGYSATTGKLCSNQ